MKWITQVGAVIPYVAIIAIAVLTAEKADTGRNDQMQIQPVTETCPPPGGGGAE